MSEPNDTTALAVEASEAGSNQACGRTLVYRSTAESNTTRAHQSIPIPQTIAAAVSMTSGSKGGESVIEGTDQSQHSEASSSKSGQGKEGGDDDLEEQRKRLEARRAYNRMNAARARKRTKDRISDLCIKVEEQAGLNTKLQKTNKELTDRLDRLSDENRELRRLAAQTRALKLGLPDAANSLFSGDTGVQNTLQQQLPGNLINVSGLLPLLQQNPILGCLPGGGFPQLLSPADQQRLLRAGLNEQQTTDSSALQHALLLQQAGLQRSLPSLVTGADTQASDPQYFDLVRSVLAGKIGMDATKEVQNESPQRKSAPV